MSGPSASRTVPKLGELLAFGGGIPDPSAKAADANDKSNNTTASIRFILFSLVVVMGEAPKRPGEQFSPNCKAAEPPGSRRIELGTGAGLEFALDRSRQARY